MLVAWVVVRNRMLKTVKCRGPKFHAIQIPAQALERFDQVSHDRICCRFRHCDALCLVSDVAASLGLRGGTRSCSRRPRLLAWLKCVWRTVPPQLRLGDAVSVPDFTSTTPASESISRNSAGSAP